MAGAGGAAGPVPDECDQPPGTPLDRYHNYGQQDIDDASTVVRAAWRSAQSREFESQPQQLFFDAHKDVYLYIQCMYIVCKLYKLVCTWYRHVHHFECSLHCLQIPVL